MSNRIPKKPRPICAKCSVVILGHATWVEISSYSGARGPELTRVSTCPECGDRLLQDLLQHQERAAALAPSPDLLPIRTSGTRGRPA
jgi:hypothetical protein